MRKKATIIILIMILIIQAIMPVKAKAFIETREITSTPAQKENQKAQNFAFDSNITYTWEYHKKGDLMAYGLYIPSNANKFKSIPLILYLHGSGDTAVSESALRKSSLPGIWERSDWNLENFSAYVLCPHLLQYNGSWQTNEAKNNVIKLLNNIIKEYNVDPNNIILCGESRGGTGALSLAYSHPQYFSKCVAFSPFYTGPFNTSMDTLCFYSWYADGASSYARYYKNAFGEDKVFSCDSGHGSVGWYFLRRDGDLAKNGIGVAR